MGSLLKEYLTKNQDESNDVDIGNREEISTSEDVKDEKDEPEGIKEDIKEPNKIHHFDNVVAIVDPPRVGLHPTVSVLLFYWNIGGVWICILKMFKRYLVIEF